MIRHKGAWYCALENKTAIVETVHHQIRRMEGSGMYERPLVPYKPLLFSSNFLHGLLVHFMMHEGYKTTKVFLGPDPETAYPLGQELAREIIAEGGQGIIYPSVRRPGGFCLVAFYPQMVRDLQFGSRLKLNWNWVTQIYGRGVLEAYLNPIDVAGLDKNCYRVILAIDK